MITAPDRIRATFQPGPGVLEQKVRESSKHLADLLEICLGHRVDLETEVIQSFPQRPAKRRPIRRDFSSVPATADALS